MTGCISSRPANIGVYRRPALPVPMLEADTVSRQTRSAPISSAALCCLPLRLACWSSKCGGDCQCRSRQLLKAEGRWRLAAGGRIGSGGYGALACGCAASALITCISNHGSEESKPAQYFSLSRQKCTSPIVHGMAKQATLQLLNCKLYARQTYLSCRRLGPC